MDTISIGKITKGNNSAKKQVEQLLLKSARRLSCFILLPRFVKLSRPNQSYRADTISTLKITKGNNSAKDVGGETVVNLCTSSGHALYFYQVL